MTVQAHGDAKTGFDTTPVTVTVSPAPAPATVETGFGDLGGTPAPVQQATPLAADDEIDSYNMPVPQITLITKRDTPALMSKHISLTNDGKLHSDGSKCLMVTGTAARAFARTASDMARIVASCRSDQAIALGALRKDLSNPVQVTTKDRLDQNPGAIARAQGFIDYRPGIPAWALIDFDTKGMTREVSDRIDAAGGIWNALLTVAPELANAARVSRASTSAGLFRPTQASRSPVQTACTITCSSATAVISSDFSRTYMTGAGCTASVGI